MISHKSSGSPTPAILVVDDEPAIMSSLRRVFRRDGYEILTAESGVEALSILDARSVDVVISDMRMQGMNGADFLAHVFARWPRTMRLLLTGFADLEATVEAVNAGHIYRYIRKPWQNHEIRSAIRDALSVKRLSDERDELLKLSQDQNQRLKAVNCALEDANEERGKLTRQLQWELEFAARIQRALLPSNDTAPYPLYAANLPARQLSGDFYDFMKTDAGMAFCLGDVSGKGANAALISAKVDGMFRVLVQAATPLGEILDRINEELYRMQSREIFLTFVAGMFDDRSGELTLANAGHPPIILLPDTGDPTLIYADLPPLGIDLEWQYCVRRFPDFKGKVCCYSDGVIECRTRAHPSLSIEGLTTLLDQSRQLGPLETVDFVLSRFECDSLPDHTDDITMLVSELARGSAARER